MSTALVPVAASDPLPPAGVTVAPRANFLAQLIATVVQAPQTRTRRRVEPGEAVAAYDASDRSPIREPHALSRSL